MRRRLLEVAASACAQPAPSEGPAGAFTHLAPF